MQYSRRDARVSERQEGNPVAPSAEGGKGIRIVAQMLGPVRFDVSASSALSFPGKMVEVPTRGQPLHFCLCLPRRKGFREVVWDS